LVVPGRKKYSTPPNGGTYRPVSGPLPAPMPRPSKSMLQRMTFWKACDVSHHDPKLAMPPIPGVKLQKNIQPPT
jgi:hypothetical protein